MSAQPRILDLFCCAGGAGMGYHRAGFEVIGADQDYQPRYPFTFLQGNALHLLADSKFMRQFQAVHTSPPCQWSSNLSQGTNKHRRHLHLNLIPQTRELLQQLDIPWVIENVQGSEVRRDQTLCGLMFGLKVFRHRYFELSNWSAPAPAHVSHTGHRVAGWRHGEKFAGDMFAVYGDGGGKGSVPQWKDAMGINWTDDKRELAEAIPPAYTQSIGTQLLAHLKES